MLSLFNGICKTYCNVNIRIPVGPARFPLYHRFNCNDGSQLFEINHPAGRIYIMVCKFIFGELFLAFGVAASLLGLRCVCGPRKWIVKTINFMWKRAVSIALIYGYVVFATIVILLLIKLFSSFL